MRLSKSKRAKGAKKTRTNRASSTSRSQKLFSVIILCLGIICGITWTLLRPEQIEEQLGEHQKLERAEQAMIDVMKKIGGNRFAPNAKNSLEKLSRDSKSREELFATLSILAFWHLHREGASKCSKIFARIKNDNLEPTETSKTIVGTWIKVLKLLEQHKRSDVRVRGV